MGSIILLVSFLYCSLILFYVKMNKIYLDDRDILTPIIKNNQQNIPRRFLRTCL